MIQWFFIFKYRLTNRTGGFCGSENTHHPIIWLKFSCRLTVWSAISPRHRWAKLYNLRVSRPVEERSYAIVTRFWQDQKVNFLDSAKTSSNRTKLCFLTEYFDNRIIGLDSKMKTGNGIDRPLYSPDLMRLLLIGKFER